MSRVIEIPVDRLVWHESTQASKLAPMFEASWLGAAFPPIDVVPASSQFVIIDGAHRARVAQGRRLRNIPAIVHDLPRCVEVPGWSHMISESTARRLVAGHRSTPGADGIADVVLDGQIVPLGPENVSLGALHFAFHSIGLHVEEDLESQTEGTVLFTWHPPRLDQLVAIALTLSPLPHTVTRFAPVLQRWSPRDSHEKEVALAGAV